MTPLRKLLLAVVLLGAVALPLTANTYLLAVASRVMIYGMLAMSLDLIMGYAGLISFGHAAYFGTGAYIVAALMLGGVTSGFIAFPLAVCGAAMAAAIVGALSLRTRGIYFIMITLAFAQMFYYLAIGQQSLGGDDGMSLPGRSDFGSLIDLSKPSHFYYFTFTLLAGVSIALSRIVRSRFGLLLDACRQNETRLLTVGIPTYRYKLVGFVIAGAVAGLAGALMVNLEAYVSPNLLDWKVSGIITMMIVMGGIRTLYGSLIGAALYIALEVAITPYTTHWMAILGPLLVVTALFWRRGIWGLLRGPDRPTQPASGSVRLSEESAPSAYFAKPAADPQAQMTATVLSARNLVKRFGGLVATDEVDFSVLEGEVHGLIGPNGAGKTTLIAQLAGLLRSDSGSIRFADTDITHLGSARRAQLGLARTFQITSIFSDFTVLENVLVAVQAHAGHCFRFWKPVRGDKQLRQKSFEILGRLNLAPRHDVKAGALAHGEKRLLEIAIAIAGSPRVLLLDEPTAGLGSRESEDIKQMLQGWRGKYAIILIEHDMDAVFRLCDRVSVMANGRLIASGQPEDIRSNEEVQRAYLGDEEVV
jgi:branched-chain amino acid transport system permease protein